MEWYVYVFDINKQKIEKYNIFKHYSFRQEVFNLASKFRNNQELSYEEELDKILKYYFWSKAEWEIIIGPWVGGKSEKCEIKIDVYNQVKLNWEAFLDMFWEEIFAVGLYDNEDEDNWDFEEWDILDDEDEDGSK